MSALLEPHAMAGSPSLSSPPSKEGTPCYFLEKLSAELRNNIYELVFTSEDFWIESKPIDLCTATPPSKNLILTCREIYQDANKMYKAMYREYWRSGFIIHDMVRKPDRNALEALREEDLLHMGSLEIRNCGPEKLFRTVYLLTANKTGWELGFWEGEDKDEWDSEIFARDKYEVNPYSRVGAVFIGWDNFYTEAELDAAAAQDSGQTVPLKAQILKTAMQNYDEGDCLSAAADDDTWRGKYCEELSLASK